MGTAARGGSRDHGVQERSRAPLGSIACSADVNIWLPFRDEREEAQRDRTVSSKFPSCLLPSPTVQPGQCCQIPHHGTSRPRTSAAAERRAGTRLVTHPCPRVTKPEFCPSTPKLAGLRRTLPSQLRSTDGAGSAVTAPSLPPSAAATGRRGAGTLRPPGTGRTDPPARLSAAVCQATELLVGCRDAVSCPYGYRAAPACAFPAGRTIQSTVWDICTRTNATAQAD